MTFKELADICEQIDKGKRWEYKLAAQQDWLLPCDQSPRRLGLVLENCAELRIAPDLKFRQWTAIEVPLCCILRHKQSHSLRIIRQLYDEYRVLLCDSGIPVNYEELLESWEYTDDLKTWKPCGKEVVE